MGREKFSAEKIEIIKAYKTGAVSYLQLNGIYGMNPDEIYRRMSKHEAYRDSAFRRNKSNSRYSKQFKKNCVEEYLRGEDSLDNITAKYNLPAKEMLWR